MNGEETAVTIVIVTDRRSCFNNLRGHEGGYVRQIILNDLQHNF
jgi:hypothetical protein